ncbi:DUF3599 family protein (plasmid) [Bacillus cereus]|uniref:DUF3599 family protein n=1 Tax=Bacillus cereus group TaxID=86661 RepID=UPI0005A35DD8|nr:DUF3599 family protein [Bacillus cereus]AJH60161.1 hypothetical protein BG11_5828 [Bacillus cereus]AJK31956.1 hypothetical protein BF33_5791 [Bacillus cereus]KWU56842.1 hypothetical protein AWW71_20365 [Bacillus cereus]KWW52342.1 hypothetical protein AWW69_04165 [Bacillus cereus]QKH64054.1 DUF3599 family protein [Bacillus cereus]
MSLQGMFVHECDIYHLQKKEQPGKYGQPGETVYSYNETPNIVGQSCYFAENVATAAPDTIQSLPNQLNTEQIKVLFIPGTDVRHNDKVIKRNTNITYYIRNPFPVVHPLTGEVNHIKAIAERKSEPWLAK